VTSWGNSTLDPVGILVPKFKTGGRGNYSGYSNEKVDQLLSLAENTLDNERRERYYKEVQELIYEDAPMIFGYAAEEIYAFRKRVKNFTPSSSGMMNMHDVYVENGD
jgi:peptide/nickel transport system substrate-binding protein